MHSYGEIDKCNPGEYYQIAKARISNHNLSIPQESTFISNGGCVPCTNSIPRDSAYISNGNFSNSCRWKCPEGWYLKKRHKCARCLPTQCPVGQYLSGCGDEHAGTCRPCTGRPSNSGYTSSGGLTDACWWACNVTFYQDGNRCVSCKNSECPIGTYRTKCGGKSPGFCQNCTHKPEMARFVGSGTLSDTCPWVCPPNFFHRDNDVETCVSCQSLDCETGHYRSGCGDAPEPTPGGCLPCTHRAKNAFFTASGGMLDACPFDCKTGFWRHFDSCRECQNICPAGEFLEGCRGSSMGQCTACMHGSRSSPWLWRYTGSGGDKDDCPWQCLMDWPWNGEPCELALVINLALTILVPIVGFGMLCCGVRLLLRLLRIICVCLCKCCSWKSRDIRTGQTMEYESLKTKDDVSGTQALAVKDSSRLSAKALPAETQEVKCSKAAPPFHLGWAKYRAFARLTPQMDSCVDVERNASKGNLAIASPVPAGAAHECINILSRNDFNDANSKREDGSTLLHVIAHCGHYGVCRALLARSDFLEVNAKDGNGRTALHIAVERGHLDVVGAILGNKHFGEQNARDGHSRTALHLSAMNGRTDIFRVILQCPGVTAINVQDSYGNTPLHFAAECGAGSICSSILGHPDLTSINAKNVRGNTALHLAAWRGHAEICRSILAWRSVDGAGVDLDIQNDEKQTALDLAIKFEEAEAARAIRMS
eukprot:gnl/MRDRNA2_/MRDRNA2_155404_c0_seq1.p1 gnl/MRDRNA2_/MRDRNA2_155404_c0~~gnl/MRDRNA2_/MRDRNA2_155404_c0_seq1.p1  ORF type:complete len:743 (-),score=83.10 gnl/MRDRNA2_/MRDRNA2_155404_c0_seq1:9-2132(-)